MMTGLAARAIGVHPDACLNQSPVSELRSMKFILTAMAFCLAVLLPAASEIPQPKLQTTSLEIVSGDTRHAFSAELAREAEEIRIGMMGRETMAADAGMLFDLGDPRPARFWMKNTLIPLDMLFIRSDGRIVAIAEHAEPGSLRRIGPDVSVKAVLELNGGRAEQAGIQPGDRVIHPMFANAGSE